MSAPVALIVLAKAPVPGRVKTRLCPPCTPEEAAALAGAAIEDTLSAAAASSADRLVLVLDGDPAGFRNRGLELHSQCEGGLDARLAGAFADAGGSALLVGMDTPQVTPILLDAGLEALRGGASSVLGPAADGGYWAIGLQAADERLFLGVEMSTARTGAEQRARLCAHGCDPVLLPSLRDVDTMDDARAAAAAAPDSRFAARLQALGTLA